jgi:hypothetical protein
MHARAASPVVYANFAGGRRRDAAGSAGSEAAR